jgi:hypothetical protein
VKAGGKQSLTFNGLLGIIYLKTELFITTTVGISNPTRINQSINLDSTVTITVLHIMPQQMALEIDSVK